MAPHAVKGRSTLPVGDGQVLIDALAVAMAVDYRAHPRGGGDASARSRTREVDETIDMSGSSGNGRIIPHRLGMTFDTSVIRGKSGGIIDVGSMFA